MKEINENEFDQIAGGASPTGKGSIGNVDIAICEKCGASFPRPSFIGCGLTRFGNLCSKCKKEAERKH